MNKKEKLEMLKTLWLNHDKLENYSFFINTIDEFPILKRAYEELKQEREKVHLLSCAFNEAFYTERNLMDDNE